MERGNKEYTENNIINITLAGQRPPPKTQLAES